METKTETRKVVVTVITAELPEVVVKQIKDLQTDHSLDDAQFIIEATSALTAKMNRRHAMMNALAAKNSKAPGTPKKRGPYKKKEKGEPK